MGASCSTSSDSHRKSSRVRSNKYKSDGVGHQPPELVESTKNQTKFSPPKARKSTEKKSDRPSEIKKSVSNHEAIMTGIGSNNDEFYDGIPRYPRAQSQKCRSTRTKQVGDRKAGAFTYYFLCVVDSLCTSFTSLKLSSDTEVYYLIHGSRYCVKGHYDKLIQT